MKTPAAVFLGVFAVQLALVAYAGTDVPFHDQWNVEGHWLYPAWLDGSLGWASLGQEYNGHRIAWTHLLNLALFAGNGGQWDPLVQMVAGAALHALVAAGLCRLMEGVAVFNRAWWIGAVVLGLSLPLPGWHNALWGFQSQFYFLIGFVTVAVVCLAGEQPSVGRTVLGVAATVAAALAMGAGTLVPVALLAGWAVRVVAARSCSRRQALGGGGLLLLALGLWCLHPPSHGPDPSHAATLSRFLGPLGRLLAWPHVAQPWAAWVMTVPMWALLGRRIGRGRPLATGEQGLLVAGFWACLAAGAAAWSRGASGEFAAGVPSRYADFLAVLALVNFGCVVILAGELAPPQRRVGRWLAGGWVAFLLLGWLGLSAEAWRRVLVPRGRDVEAPVRLMQAFQRTDDAAVFTGQPRLLVPHPDLDAVREVLRDARMEGALPPSLQPERPMGPLSKAVRWLLRR